MSAKALDILEDSLNKKLGIMLRIQEENTKQNRILSNTDNVDPDAFDKTLDVKGGYIDELNAIDDGFETLFEQVKLEVGDHKELYHNQIERLQKLIRDITAAGSRIQTQEHDNKSLAEKYFSYEREKMTAGKKNSIAAFNYYQTMSKSKDIPPQFMDQKI